MILKDIALEIVKSVAKFYNLKVKYGCIEASDVKRLKDIEAEHAELK